MIHSVCSTVCSSLRPQAKLPTMLRFADERSSVHKAERKCHIRQMKHSRKVISRGKIAKDIQPQSKYRNVGKGM